VQPVHRGAPRGPLADAVVADLREWLTVQGYSPRTIPQVVSVALWLSAWMDDHGAGLEALDGGLLDQFTAGLSRVLPGAAWRSAGSQWFAVSFSSVASRDEAESTCLVCRTYCQRTGEPRLL
jgi:hypothetical protein